MPIYYVKGKIETNRARPPTSYKSSARVMQWWVAKKLLRPSTKKVCLVTLSYLSENLEIIINANIINERCGDCSSNASL